VVVGKCPKIRRDVSAGAWLPGLAETRLCNNREAQVLSGETPAGHAGQHGQDVHGQDARATHGQDARATHGQDAHATHGQDARATHGQDAHATHGQDARATAATLDGSSSASGSVPRGGSRPRPPKLYRIGEVVSYSGVSRQTVHNYTIMGLLHEAQWTEGGHRLYDESVFARLDLVVEFKSQGKSLVEIRECCSRLDENEAASQEE